MSWALPAANCEGTDGEAWFATDARSVAWCRKVCAACPLKAVCLAGALARDEQYGVWGGRLFRRRWLSGRVLHHHSWWADGRDADGVRVHAWAKTETGAEDKLAALLDDGQRRGLVIGKIRRLGRPIVGAPSLWTGPWDTHRLGAAAAAELRDAA